MIFLSIQKSNVLFTIQHIPYLLLLNTFNIVYIIYNIAIFFNISIYFIYFDIKPQNPKHMKIIYFIFRNYIITVKIQLNRGSFNPELYILVIYNYY